MDSARARARDIQDNSEMGTDPVVNQTALEIWGPSSWIMLCQFALVPNNINMFCTVKSLSMKTDALLSPISPPLPPVSPHEVRGDETAPPATARSLVHTRGVSSAGKNTDTPQILLKTYKLKAITGLVQQVNIEPYLFRSLSVMSALVCSRGT